MIRFILKRMAFVLPQLLIVVVACFVLLRVLPVDPVSRSVGILASPEAYALAEHQLGLDRSLGAQLGSYLAGLFHFDLGKSWSTGEPVLSQIGDRFPVTLQLIIVGFVLAALIAIPIGMVTAAKPGGRVEKATMGYALFAGAQPDFWWGLLFVYIFFYHLHWFPAPLGLLDPAVIGPSGPTNFILLDTLVAGRFDLFVQAVHHYTLAWMTLAFVLTGPILKIMRQSALDVLSSDYLLYAKASGLSGRRIRPMIMRNAFAPVLTVTGILFGFSLGGAVLIESVFSLDGLGRYALDSTLSVDFPAIQGAVITMTVFSLLIYLLMDFLYAALDPRVRYGSA